MKRGKKIYEEKYDFRRYKMKRKIISILIMVALLISFNQSMTAMAIAENDIKVANLQTSEKSNTYLEYIPIIESGAYDG